MTEYSSFIDGKNFTDGEGNSITICRVEELRPEDSELRCRFVEASKRKELVVLEAFANPSTVALQLFCGDVDHVGIVNKSTNKVELVFCDDGITFESVSPLQLVEYAFEKGRH